MSPGLIVTIIVAYFIVLLVISYFTGKNSSNASFFIGNRKSPWFIVAFGMIGASLSGVTFISVPGWVGTSHFAYMQMVLGYLLGYFVIANVLMPMYYRMNLTSIYTYLNSRFGFWSYKSGASFFLISRVVGASFRLLLVANVLQFTVFNAWNVPFWATVTITIALIWLYTFRGGIRTIIWTDTLQTIFMLTAVILCSYFIMKDLGLGFEEMVKTIDNSELSRIFYFDNWKDEHHFVKQFLSGAFITIVMTGLDQDMMQKNLSCRNIHEAKKNMYWFSIVLVPVNLLFLSLGVMLYFYAAKMGISLPERSDNLFPLIATGGYLQPVIAVFFIIGLVAAAYSSADSALTALTTSFTVDILNTRDMLEEDLKKLRQKVHVGISLMILIVILIFRAINDQSIIAAVFTFAGYTYGPLLGLYAFGLFTKRMPTDKWVPWISVAAPVIGAILSFQSKDWFNGYEFGFEILIVNGLITFMGLWAISSRGNQ